MKKGGEQWACRIRDQLHCFIIIMWFGDVPIGLFDIFEFWFSI